MTILDKRVVRRLASTASTNSVALLMAGQGEPAGSVVVAETQTKGRGRLGRGWLSPPGTGLYFSMILRPSMAWQDLVKIPLAAGVAICKAIEKECGLAPKLKWPNDLLLGGKKFGGILTETGPVTAGASFVVLGVGLNITTPKTDFPPPLQARSTSLFLHTGRVFDKEKLLSAIVLQIDNIVPRMEAGEFSEIFNEWRARDTVQGAVLSWLTPPHGEVIRGVALGLNDAGGYQIRDNAGVVHEVLSGDLSIT